MVSHYLPRRTINNKQKVQAAAAVVRSRAFSHVVSQLQASHISTCLTNVPGNSKPKIEFSQVSNFGKKLDDYKEE